MVHAADLTTSEALARDAPQRALLTALAASHHLALIDPYPFLTRDGLVPALSALGKPIYKDTHHLRASYVRAQVRWLDGTIGLEGLEAPVGSPGTPGALTPAPGPR